MKKALVSVLALLALAAPGDAQRRPAAPIDTSDRPRIDVESYEIEVTFVPDLHELKATADVRFKQLERMSYVTFDLDNRLRIDKVTLNGEEARFRQFDLDSTLEVSIPPDAVMDAPVLHFEYRGFLDPEGDRRNPVLATVSEEGAFLLYDGKWFPVNDVFKDKAAAAIRVNAPEGWTILADLPARADGTANSFSSADPSYWGLIAAGKYTSTGFKTGGADVTAHTAGAKPEDAQAIAEAAGKVFDFYGQTFGPAPSARFQIVEAQGANWTSRWAPGVLLLPSTQFRPDFDAAALARAIAHQWFPLKVSVEDPARDAWLVDGMAAFAALLYAEANLSPAEAQEQIDRTLVKALANETEMPVQEAGSLDRDSPDYTALVEFKGAYILRMLRWVMGEEKFGDLLTRYVERFQATPASTSQMVKLASDISGDNLEYFFDQWLNDSGVPEMETEWIVSRVRNGYRVDGEIRQDLDLFRMPIELEIETDGEPEYKRIDVSGPASEFSVMTERKPKSIVIDPRKQVLRMAPDIRVAVSINRGEEFMNDGRFNDAEDQFQDAIDADPNNSLASFRMGEALFEIGNLTAANQNFRNALSGNLKPRWVEVWSYINLGKIQDIRGDRDRALGEYQKAVSTGDDSFGAQADAQKYIDSPFRRGQR